MAIWSHVSTHFFAAFVLGRRTCDPNGAEHIDDVRSNPSLSASLTIVRPQNFGDTLAERFFAKEPLVGSLPMESSMWPVVVVVVLPFAKLVVERWISSAMQSLSNSW